MAKPPTVSIAEQVAAFHRQLDHPLQPVVEALRQVVLSADPAVAEQIKWNSPSFYFTGEMPPFDPKTYKRDIVVFNLHKKDRVLLVFPTGATIPDTTGLLGGTFPDSRKTCTFTNPDEVRAKGQALQTVIRQWLRLVEK